MNKKSIRNSIIACGTSVALCVGLLAGTTFAWFTDKVSNSGNKIQAGNLQIGATAYDEGTGGQSVAVEGLKTFTFEAEGANLKTSTDPIVNESAWAPGNVGAKLLEVKNYGNLAAEIKLDFNISGDLTEVLWYDFVKVDGNGNVLGKFEERDMSTLPTYAAKLEFPLGAMSEENDNDELRFVFVYGMDEEADNDWQGKSFSADVTILAKQANPDEAEYPTVEVDGVQVDTEINGKPVKLEKAEPDSALYTNTLDESDENYYIISDKGLDALADMLTLPSVTTFSARNTAALEASFVMAADIDMAGRDWTPLMVENTNLVFDGNGHTISGMNAVVTEDTVTDPGTPYAGAGFIGKTYANSIVTVKNVVFDGAYVSVSDGGNNQQTYAGVVVGHNQAALTIENVTVQNSKVVCHWQTGGLVGYSDKDLTFTGCRVENTFIGGANATAGTLFGLGIVNLKAVDCVSENVQLYTDNVGSGVWDQAAIDNGQYMYGSIYEYANKGKTFTNENSIVKNIEIVSEEAVTYVSTAEQLAEAVMYKGGNIEVTADMVLDLSSSRITKDTAIDLNGNTLTNETAGTVIAADGASLTIKDGTINKLTHKGRSDFGAAKGSSLKLENLTVTSGDAIALIGSDNEELKDGTNARIDIIGCTLTSFDSNAVSTNASYKAGDYYCEINIENSTIKCVTEEGSPYVNDNCPVFINVNGKLTMTDTTVIGERQGVMVRGGDAVLTNCTISTSGEYANKDQYFESNWGSGNEVPMAALVIGNRNSSAYQYPTDVQLINCKITAENGVPAVYAYGNSVPNKAALTYDEATQINGEIIKGGAATVNAQGVATAEELKATQSNPGSYALIDDITFSISGYGDVTEYQKGNMTLDLNGKTIKLTSTTNANIFYAMSVQGGNLTLNGEGGIDASEAGAYALVMYGMVSGTLTINGGTYIGETSAIQLGAGTWNENVQTCYINGGFFKATGENAEKFTLNCIDALYKAGKANFIVTGGTFVNFNPADNASEGEHTNYVAKGYKVVSEQQENGEIWYTVVPENA